MFAKDHAARDKSKARFQEKNRTSVVYGYSPVSGFTIGRARLCGARYAVPVLLRPMEDLRRIGPGATFNPDNPSAAAAPKLQAGRAGPEGEPVMEPPPRIAPLLKPPSVLLGSVDADKHTGLSDDDGMPRRDVEPIARQAMEARNSSPWHELIWVIIDSTYPPLRRPGRASLHRFDPSGVFALALGVGAPPPRASLWRST